MYTSFFGLDEKPFAITPDPRYLYLSEQHAEALAHLTYGIKEAGGFIQLTGEVGTGKTTIVRSLLQQLPANCDVALILNPTVSPVEFLLAICDELHVSVPPESRGSLKDLFDLLSRILLKAHAAGRRVVVMVDEAQNLAPEVLEQVRLLTNLETATQKLLQIILIGQPELRGVLARSELRQLAQRITGRYHLDALSATETAAYVRHRLRVAGGSQEIFTAGALRELHRLSGGIPRIVNVISDRALLGAFTLEERTVTRDLVRRAASEVYDRPVLPFGLRFAAILGAVAGVGLLVFALWQFRSSGDPPPAPVAPVPANAEPARRATIPLAGLLAAQGVQTGTDAAFERLLALWGVSYAADGARPCDRAAELGLQCLSQRGSIAELRALNRPAILSLVDLRGDEHQVVVTGIGDDSVRLALGVEAPRVSITDLTGMWFGDFLLVWRPPSLPARDLQPGARGADVRWLRQHLLGSDQGTPADGSDVYDAELTRLVEDFQRARRLAVDGVASVLTQVAIDAAHSAPGAPVLAGT
ncbi:MAG: AAA family ATPase [Steroidobacteraceae bacterium]